MLNFVERVMACKDIQEIWEFHKETMAGFGFNRVLYGFTRYRTANSLGDPQDMLILTNHERDYIRPFLDDGLYFHAPMVRWALENVGSCSWRWIEEQYEAGNLSPSERRIFEFNRENGMKAGYSVSFLDNSLRAKGAVGLSSVPGMSYDEADAIWAEHGRIIEAMNNMVHLRLISMPYTGARRPLTPRQREALEWVGDGKTMQDIATIMGLTQATVEKHLRLAREALDVETTAQAVLKASFQNQIFILDGSGDDLILDRGMVR